MGVFKLIFSVFLLISVANGIIFKDYDGIRIGQESVYVPKYRKAGGGILAGRSLLGSDDEARDCHGSITIATAELGLVGKISNEDNHRIFNARKYWKLLDVHAPVYLETHGSCCWRVFSKSYYRGRREMLFPGSDEVLLWVPNSIKLVEC